jgi:hypothetical protein
MRMWIARGLIFGPKSDSSTTTDLQLIQCSLPRILWQQFLLDRNTPGSTGFGSGSLLTLSDSELRLEWTTFWGHRKCPAKYDVSSGCYSKKEFLVRPILVAAWICSRLLTGIAGSNPARSMMCICWECGVFAGRSLLCRADHLSRGDLQNMNMSVSVIMYNSISVCLRWICRRGQTNK